MSGGAVVVIQARLSSTRLPRKVLMDLAGQPVLDWVVMRVGAAATQEGVVVATTTSRADDELAEYCLTRGWSVFRGSEEDVLSRYASAALAHRADVVVRVTSDCPFVDPRLIDQVVGTLREKGADYASNILEPRTFPRGLDVEAFTRAALERAEAEAEPPGWREHVTPFFYRQPERFALAGVWNDIDYSSYRWTLDTPEDLEYLRAVAGAIEGRSFSWREALAEARQHLEWERINRHVKQKPVDPTRRY